MSVGVAGCLGVGGAVRLIQLTMRANFREDYCISLNNEQCAVVTRDIHTFVWFSVSVQGMYSEEGVVDVLSH